MAQLALKLVYENKIITRENALTFLSGTDFKSGDKLYNLFTKWSKKQYRIANPDKTKLILDNKIKLFEEVIKRLNSKYANKAKEELKILQKHLEIY